MERTDMQHGFVNYCQVLVQNNCKSFVYFRQTQWGPDFLHSCQLSSFWCFENLLGDICNLTILFNFISFIWMKFKFISHVWRPFYSFFCGLLIHAFLEDFWTFNINLKNISIWKIVMYLWYMLHIVCYLSLDVASGNFSHWIFNFRSLSKSIIYFHWIWMLVIVFFYIRNIKNSTWGLPLWCRLLQRCPDCSSCEPVPC